MLRAFTPASAIAPLAGAVPSSMAKYLEDDLQKILRIVLNSRHLAYSTVLTSAPHHKSPCEKLLKAQFLDVYRDKIHIECYNLFQKCKDQFATADATKPNRVLFMAIFLKNTALFCWQ